MALKRVLVAGASGVLGTELMRELRGRQVWVRALVRDPSRLGVEADEVFVADVTKPETLKGACARVDAVFTCVGAPLSPKGPRFDLVDDWGNRNLLTEAVSAKVARFGCASVFGGLLLGSDEYIRAHESFAAAVRTAKVSPLVVRPTVTFASLLTVLERARSGSVRVVAGGEAQTNPIHEADAATAIADALDSDETDLSLGGPELLTQRQVAEVAFDALGREPHIRSTPNWLSLLGVRYARWRGAKANDVALHRWLAATTELKAPAVGTRTLADYFADRA
ncbi:MAG: NAD(P)H-binding protein [Chloroflexota bacterium]